MTKRSTPTGGFTLVELLVAMAVLSIMVLMLTEILNRTGTAWTLGQAQAERRQSARAVADVIVRELEPALMPVDPADQNSLQFLLNPISLSADLRNSDTLFWQAPIASDNTRGDVAEVGYFLKWDTSSGTPRPLFCRFFVNPTDQDHYLLFKTPSAWLTNDIINQVAPANNQTGGYAGLFAENVIGFWVRCYDKDGKCLNTYDSRVQKVLPRTVKVFLVLLGPTGLERLNQKPDYSTAGAGDEPDLDAFINALPLGVRSAARPFITEVFLQNAQ